MTSKAQQASNSFTRTLTIKTSKRTELKRVTAEIESLVRESGCAHGVCHLYVPHTTAGILINEGDDPAVARDIESTLDRLIRTTAITSTPKATPTRTSNALRRRQGLRRRDSPRANRRLFPLDASAAK